MQVQIVREPECWICMEDLDLGNEVEVVLDTPQHDARIVDGEARLVTITSRYFCSEAHANDYKQYLANHRREVEV